MADTDLKNKTENTKNDAPEKEPSFASKQNKPVKAAWKNPTKQNVEVFMDGKAISFLPGERKVFEDGSVWFGQNTRLIKV